MQLSIIVPIYNVEKYLEKCLASIQNQTYTDYEVLMINDGSTDNSKQVAEKFSNADSRFKYFEVPNAGVSSARNIGIGKAGGDYLTFVDSDDYLDLEHAQVFMDKIVRYDIVVGGYKVIDTEIEVREHEASEVFDQQQLIQGILKDSAIFSFPWNKFFRREIIESHNIRFRTDIHYGEDLIFDIQYALQVENAYILNSDSYNYVQHGNSASGKLNKNSLAKRMTDMDAVIRTIELIEKDFPDEVPFLKKRLAREGMEYYYLAKKFKLDPKAISKFYKKIHPYVKWVQRYAKKDVRWLKIMIRLLVYRIKVFTLDI